jgi:molybdopterin-guanine dinucleotide biosynthesis protein A
MKHVKHAKLEKPDLEGLASRHLAFVGSPCHRLEQAMDEVRQLLSPRYRSATVDADHKKKVEGVEIRQDERIIAFSPFTSEQWFEDKLLGQYLDLALINGNHYPAPHQIVFLDTEKEASLKRRLDQLTDVLAYIRVDCDGFDWLEMTEGVPTIDLTDITKLAGVIDQWMNASKSPLRALILAGGESRRMGHDKSQIDYHGRPQEVHLAEVCQELGLTVSISKRHEERDEIGGFPVLKDVFLGMGPYGAILTAFQKYRNTALLVLACDLPFIDGEKIKELITSRAPHQFMTALKGASKDFAEPLVAIYEPRMYPRMLHGLGLGYNCPTKLLRNTDIQSVEVKDEVVMNINTPEDLADVDQRIKDEH